MDNAELDLLYQNISDELFTTDEFPLDDAVRASFPNHTKITAQNYGTSAWTRTARLDVENSDGTRESYFLKCATDDAGRVLLEGEFNSMKELNKFMPNFAPKPHSWGKYKTTNPDMYFFLSQFIHMNDRVPDPKRLCQKLVQLHHKSESRSGKFGFHVTTCRGHIPQSVPWADTWTECFTNMFLHVKKLDFQTNGHWSDLEKLENRIVSHIIPRLIGILEQDGRKVKPSLIHGDLWEGNTGTSYETGEVYIFDAAALYAHNELETGNWRCHYNKIHDPIYTRTYLEYFECSEPRAEWEDRNRMYSIYCNILYSVNHANHGTAVRQTAYDDMFFLIDKFAPFPKDEEPPRINDGDRARADEEPVGEARQDVGVGVLRVDLGVEVRDDAPLGVADYDDLGERRSAANYLSGARSLDDLVHHCGVRGELADEEAVRGGSLFIRRARSYYGLAKCL